MNMLWLVARAAAGSMVRELRQGPHDAAAVYSVGSYIST